MPLTVVIERCRAIRIQALPIIGALQQEDPKTAEASSLFSHRVTN